MPEQIVDETDIVRGLARLWVRPTICVMVHAALSKFGYVAGGPQTVVGALRRAAGENGAVIAPSFRDAIRSDYYALRQCEAVCPQRFCPSQERGYTGKIGETVREQTDCLRSCHPTHSWVGIGGGSAFLLEGHRYSPTPCGRDSPFIRLMQHDGVVVLLGVGVNALTNIHVVEDVRNVPYLSAVDPDHRHATYTTSGRRIQYYYPNLFHLAMARAGIMRTTTIGCATCHGVKARDLGSFLWLITQDDPWCLVLRPCGDQYNPDEDAWRKTQGMAEAWHRNPDREAWQYLVEKSQHPDADPVQFQPAAKPRTDCPAYRGIIRSHHRCAANDIPPWEHFEDYDRDDPGVATCEHCNWC